MKCGVRFCGGCNPGYDRGAALARIRDIINKDIEFAIASEDEAYDAMLVIGGCTNCCASYEQFEFKGAPHKMWSEAHIERIISSLTNNKENYGG